MERPLRLSKATTRSRTPLPCCHHIALVPSPRRITSPWIVGEHHNACFIVKDAIGQALSYFYFEHKPARRSADVRFEATAVIGCISSETARSRMTRCGSGVCNAAAETMLNVAMCNEQ